jgi:hypothetical protein
MFFKLSAVDFELTSVTGLSVRFDVRSSHWPLIFYPMIETGAETRLARHHP